MADREAIGITSSSVQISESDRQENLEAREVNGVTHKDGGVQENTSVLVTAQALVSQALGFLSRANNDTIGACLAGLVAITYLVLGRVGLILIGIVVGVVLHATWEETTNPQGDARDDTQETRKSKKQQGFALLERILDWRERKTSESELDGDGVPRGSSSVLLSPDLRFLDFPASIGAALNALTEAVIREYVKYEDHRLNRFTILIYVVGGIALFYLWSCPSPQPAEKLLYSLSWLFHHIFHGKGRLMHS